MYFINDKMRMDQMTDLIERLIYRVKQKETLEKKEAAPAGAPMAKIPEVKSEEKEQPPSQIKFASGSSLPTIQDDKPARGGQFDFPSVGSGLNNQQNDLTNKAKQMFDDLDLDDVEASRQSKAADLDFEQGSDSGDGNFNANELLNLTDYQNKRKKEIEKKEESKPAAANLNVKDVLNPKKLDEMNKDEDDWGMSDDWGDKPLKEVKLDKNELQSKNLNQLSDEELNAYKRAMDKEFVAKQLKPGDAGFVYDKVVDFSKNRDEGPLEDDSWGEDDGVEEQEQNEYYDEEDDGGIQDALEKYTDKQIQEQIQKSRKSNMTGDDDDYFDDDFDDDFA